MLEIGRVFESALRSNSEELRKAALRTVTRLGPDASVRELLLSDAGAAIRQLSLREVALAATSGHVPVGDRDCEPPGRVPVVEIQDATVAATSDASREERVYRDILVALDTGPQTIGQLAKVTGIDTTELRAYVSWMRQMGKVASTGRARATRYHLP